MVLIVLSTLFLKALLVSLKNKETIWWVLLENLLDNYAEEIMDSEVSSAEVLEFIYETALQDTKTIKYEGVYCSTVHSVKGLEFKHVFIFLLLTAMAVAR